MDEKKTIYVKTLNPDIYDYELYDIREDEGNKVIIDGGRNFFSVDNHDYLNKIKKLIEDYDSWDYEDYYQGSIKYFLEDYLPKKENGKNLSPREMNDIKVSLEYQKDDDIICLCLQIITGEPYICQAIRGCSQGDYAKAYAPLKEREYLEWVSAWYWGTGTEIIVHDGSTIPTCAEDICGDNYFIGYWYRNDEELKELIRQEIGCSEDTKIVLWKYSKTKVIHIDEYELAD